jgi:hypothetical protein
MHPVGPFANALTPEIIHSFIQQQCFIFLVIVLTIVGPLVYFLIEPFLLSFRAGERIRVAALARFSVAGLAKS